MQRTMSIMATHGPKITAQACTYYNTSEVASNEYGAYEWRLATQSLDCTSGCSKKGGCHTHCMTTIHKFDRMDEHSTSHQPTSLARVIVSGAKFTCNLSMVPERVRVLTMLKILPCTACWRDSTLFFQSSKSCWVLSLERKLSPSCLSFWPSTWFSQPFPRTASTRWR